MSDEILDEFKEESKSLVNQMIDILEEIEGEFTQVKRLEEFGQIVDRIMGGAQSLAMAYDEDHVVHKIGSYAELCKAVGYKSSQIENNEQFYDVCVALLLDASEMLNDMLDSMSEENPDLKAIVSDTFLDRLKWVNSRFGDNVRASVTVQTDPDKKMGQGDIDDLLKSLGL